MKEVSETALENLALRKKPKKTTVQKTKKAVSPAIQKPKMPADEKNKAEPVKLPQIPVSIEVDSESFLPVLTGAAGNHRDDRERYDLTLMAYQVRFKETFDHIICLSSLKNIRSFWFQEETARKVLKSFRGRSLLADEVGLGKTIEALIVLKEYIERGMVKTVLILTPTPLVSQWKQELKSKFELDFPSTDDPEFQSGTKDFWQKPRLLASINQAKSKKNFSTVTQREYDMIIVDEAHHLKNKTTLNWKLVNALKKRFLLLLTATPVENNLMELYNLITLLKPGQLKTVTAFRQEFMTRGDATDPRNRTKLKELLGQVMIRNTRAVARINIPPRYARTIRVKAGNQEQAFYERITSLVKDINRVDGKGNKLLLKNLLEEAGSSLRAVGLTLERMLAKRELLNRQQDEIRAILNLCKSMDDTRKNKTLLKLLKSSPGKIILFVKFLGTLDELSDFLSWENIPHCLFHGGMTNKEKDLQIELFKKEKNVLLTTEIGGEGRNLQFCHQMINYDLPWNPMKIEQRIGRIHRIGQENEVLIYNLCASGSIEDYILNILDRKINMFEMVIGEIDMILGRIRGDQEFSELVYDIWVNSANEDDRKSSFNKLADRLKRSKNGYEKTRELDEKLFGENYEL